MESKKRAIWMYFLCTKTKWFAQLFQYGFYFCTNGVNKQRNRKIRHFWEFVINFRTMNASIPHFWMRYYSGKNAPDMHTHIQNNHRKTCGSLLRKWMSHHHITLVGSRFRSKFIILPEFKIEKSRKFSSKMVVDTKNESYQSSHHLSMRANWNAGFPLISNKVA